MLMLFAAVALVHLIALMSPGPDFFIHLADRCQPLATPGDVQLHGHTLEVAIWAAVALLGLHLLLSLMGWQLLRAVHRQVPVDANPPALAADGGHEHCFLRGLLTKLANPKAVYLFRQRIYRSSSAIISVPAPALGYLP